MPRRSAFPGRFDRVLAAALLMGFLSGCGTMPKYLWQAATGQLGLIRKARPLEEAASDPATSPRVRELLREVEGIRKFGEENGLKPTPNYTKYVELGRPAVVWAVQASRRLRFEAYEWKFPIVGSFPYLGWFHEKDAQEQARSIEEEGWDVDVRPVSAYSTLGWFTDPLLSSMIPDRGDALGELAEVVLHESVHATFYVKGQSTFNESLASFVAERLALAFLQFRKGVDSSEVRAWREGDERARSRLKRFHEAYVELDSIYRGGGTDEEKLARKAAVIAALKKELRIAESRPINNATLMGFKTYRTGEESFRKLLDACGGEWSRFWKALAPLLTEKGRFPREQFRDIDSVIPKSCG